MKRIILSAIIMLTLTGSSFSQERSCIDLKIVNIKSTVFHAYFFNCGDSEIYLPSIGSIPNVIMDFDVLNESNENISATNSLKLPKGLNKENVKRLQSNETYGVIIDLKDYYYLVSGENYTIRASYHPKDKIAQALGVYDLPLKSNSVSAKY